MAISRVASLASGSDRWFGFGIAMLCGGLVFYIVSGFYRPTPSYNAFAAEPIFLVGGPLVLWRFLKGDRLGSVHRSLGTGLVATLLVLGAVSTLLSENPVEAWNRLKLYYACALLGAGLYLSCRSNVRPVVVPFLLVIALIHAWFLVELMASIYAWEGRRSVPQVVATHYFAHIRHFGYLGFLAACAGTGAALLGERRILQWLGFALGVLAIYGLIQFGSRGAFIAWLVFAALLFAFVPAKRRYAFSCVAAISLASLAVLYVDASHPFPNKKQQSVFTRTAVGEDQLGTTRSRVRIWNDSWREIVKRPLLGHGPDAYVLCKCGPSGTVQPHNSLIQFLFEFGLAGTLAALLAFARFLQRPAMAMIAGQRNGRPDMALAVLIFFTISLLLFSVVDGLLYHAVPLLVFSITMALLGATAYPKSGMADVKGGDQA